MHIMYNVIMCGALYGSCAVAASAGIDCIREIELPRYSFVARRAPAGGTVKALIMIGKSGRPVTIRTPNSDENLAEEVRDTLRDNTSYSGACQGKEIEIVFTFRLEGKPSEYPMTSVHFQPPNHFVLVSEPKRPHLLFDFPK